MKALVLTAPAELREMLDGLTTSALAKRCRNFRTSRLGDPKAAAQVCPPAPSPCRYRQLSDEVRNLEAEIEKLTLVSRPGPWSKPSVWDPTRLQPY